MEHTFWTALDKLVEQSEIIIDRPKGSVHPVHPDFIYQVDYGFLRNTSSMDREGIDIWQAVTIRPGLTPSCVRLIC